jgi:hypothetical protein
VVVLDPKLEPDLVAAHRVVEVDLDGAVLQLALVSGVAIVLEDELLVERVELRSFHLLAVEMRGFNVGSGSASTNRIAAMFVTPWTSEL